jgi:conjugative relaxase-like TrwC/TraI family protein
MLTIAKMGKRSAFYYANLAQEQGEFDCSQPGEPPGQWQGSGAAALGFLGRIQRDQFLALFAGFTEDGNNLVQNAGDERRVPGWDCVFAMPKSVSVLWAIADTPTQAAIEAAHHQAVVKALQYLESHAYSRRGSGGSDLEKAGLVVATFQHGSNRNQEPYLHTHALVLNVSVREDGSTGALHSKPLYQYKLAAGAIYRAELAAELQRQLGLALEREKTWFELQGFSRQAGKYQALMNRWSSRREEIEAKHPVTAAQAQVAAYQTRKAKEPLPPRNELFAQWRTVGTEYGFSRENARRLVGQGKERLLFLQKYQEWRAVREAATQVVRHQSHFARKEMVTAISIAAQTRGLDSADVLRLTDKYLASRHVVKLGQVQGEERFANKRLYRLEKQLLAQTTKLAQERSVRVAARHVNAATQKHQLTAEQKAALQWVIDLGNLKTLTGISGTGKSYVLGAAREAFEKGGYRVLAVAHSRHGAETLHRQLGMKEQGELSKLVFGEKRQSVTLFQLLTQVERARKHGLELPLSGKTVVMVDDAQTIGAAEMKRLVEAVQQSGAKLVLSGDLKQPQAYQHSGALEAISQTVGAVELKQIHRQEQAWAKEVVQQVAEGKTQAALHTLEQKQQLSISPTKEDAMQALVSDWSQRGVGRPQDHLMIVEDEPDRKFLNRLAQTRRLEAGAIGSPKVRVGEGFVHKGDRVRFGETSYTYGVAKGDMGTVTQVEPLTKYAIVRLDSGKSRLINVRDYRALELGYAVTTYAARNLEVNHAYVMMQGKGQDQALVQISRAKVSTRVYSDALQSTVNARYELANRMRGVKENQLAVTIEQRSIEGQEKSR